MSIKDFKTSANLEVDLYELSVASSIDGQVLIYDGESYKPYDIIPVGSIEMWAGDSTPPNGWLLCDGSSYSWAQYTRLRDVIGISYGGSSDTSWNVPNLLTSSNSKTVVGVSAGDSLGNASKNFDSSSTSHSHNYTSSSYVSNTNGYGNHNHNTGNANGHTHTLDFNNWNHFHNSNSPSNTHTHSYQRGNSGGANTSLSAHANHNVGSANHAHGHTANEVSHSHGHGYDPAMGNHNHNWNMSGIGSNSAGANHTHTVNKQSIYFIIKY